MAFPVWLLLLFLSPVFMTAALAGERIALVIGNSAYETVPALSNPGNDAAGMATALEALGFEVILGLDLDRRGFVTKTKEFTSRLAGAKVALFYYAGHGLQVDGRNYLVPVDTELADEVDLDFETIRLDTIMSRMEREPRTNLVFLDACRDNPLARSLAARRGTRALGGTRGLAPVDIGIGTLIAYSTQPGNVAYDGSGAHSPFTGALLQHIDTPGADIALVLRKVRQQVLQDTGGQQLPWSNSSLTGSVVLREAPAAAPVLTAADRRREQELSLWQSIRGAGDPLVFRNFLNRFPDGDFAKEASAAAAALDRQRLRDKQELSEALARARQQETELMRLRSEKADLLQRFNEETATQQALLNTAQREADHRQKELSDLATRNSVLQSRVQAALEAQDSALKNAEQEQQAREREVALLNAERKRLESLAQNQSASQKKALAEAIDRAEESLAETARIRAEKQRLERQTQAQMDAQRRDLESARLEALRKAAEVDRLTAEKQRLELQASVRLGELARKEQRAEELAYAKPDAEGRRFEDLFPDIHASANGQATSRLASIERGVLASLPKGYQREGVVAGQAGMLPEGKVLISALQWELNRLGCDAGPVDGAWGGKSRAAVESYHRARGQTKNYLSPNAELLKTLVRETGRVCPQTCRPRYEFAAGTCVLKKCPPGQWLSEKGACYRPG